MEWLSFLRRPTLPRAVHRAESRIPLVVVLPSCPEPEEIGVIPGSRPHLARDQ